MPELPLGRQSSLILRLRSALICLAVIGFAFVSGYMLGWFRGNQQIYNNRFQEERTIVAPILAGDPAFSRIEIHARSNGGIYLQGELDSKLDQNRLRTQIDRSLGEHRGQEIMAGVDVKR